jgi:hypothetical protein
MQLTQSFFQSVDNWVDSHESAENSSLDCLNAECAGDCSRSCFLPQDPDFIERRYVNSESFVWRFERGWTRGL